MISSDQRMIETQARKISELNNMVRSRDDEIQRLKDKMYHQHLAGKFYLEMQKSILDNPSLKSEWDNFCIVLRMVCPELDEILSTVTKEHEMAYSSSNFYI